MIGEAEILGQVRRRLGAGPGGGHGRRRRSTCCSATPSRSASGPAPRPASPATSPRCRPAAVAMAAERLGALDGPDASSCSAPARWARAWCRPSLVGAGVGRRAASPTAPGTGPSSWPTAFGGRAVRLAELPARPGRGRPAAHLDRRAVADARARRPRAGDGRPAGPAAADRRRGRAPRRRSRRPATLAGVTLLDMDDLRAFAEAGMAERRREVGAGRPHRRRGGRPLRRREHRPARWRRWWSALRERAEAVRTAELERFRARLGELDDRQREAVEALTRGIVAKLLHEPTVRLKDAAGHGPGRAAGRGAARPVRPLSAVASRPRVRVGRRGAARWPGGRPTHVAEPAAAPAIPASRSSLVGGRDRRATAASTSPIWELGGKGVFVKEVQAAVLDGRADVAVHSAKDLPVDHRTDGLVIGRACPSGPIRATSWSARRWPTCRPGRGWPPARCGGGPSWPGSGPTSPSPACGATSPPGWPRRREYGAIVMAAGRARAARPRPTGIAEVLDADGDAAPGRPGRAGRRVPGRRRRTRAALLAAIDARARAGGRSTPSGRSWPSSGGGCDLPVGAYATVERRGAVIAIEGMLASRDGRVVLRERRDGPGRRPTRPTLGVAGWPDEPARREPGGSGARSTELAGRSSGRR